MVSGRRMDNWGGGRSIQKRRTTFSARQSTHQCDDDDDDDDYEDPDGALQTFACLMRLPLERFIADHAAGRLAHRHV